MGKRLILVLALALLVGLTFSAAYAEVQNVKVSGDINILGVARNDFNMGNSATPKLNSRFFATLTRVRIDADLTDNVMTTVRLINERDWTAEDNSNTDIDLDLAYVTLKEFLYSPLTLTLGRQEINFGNSLIMGNSHNYNYTSGTGTTGSNLPVDLSERKAFDALRATLNYDPLIIDAVYAKLTNSNSITSDKSADLFGVNVSYDLTKKINVQGYIWDKKDKTVDVTNSKRDNVYTVGALVTVKPVQDLKTSLEAAYQFGNVRNATDSTSRNAYALQAMADYTFSKVKFTPAVGAAYTLLSGPRKGGNTTGAKAETGWSQMFYDQRLGNIAYAILPFSNLQAIGVHASAKPVEDVTLTANLTNFRLAEGFDGTSSTPTITGLDGNAITLTDHRKDLGNELDITGLYDYTEDVQLGLTWGYFAAGKAIASSRGNASELIGSVKVTF